MSRPLTHGRTTSRVRSAVGVRRGEHRAARLGVDVERAALRVAHEGDARVLRQAPGLRQVDARRQVGVDRRDRLAVELALGLGAVVLADEADVDVGARRGPRARRTGRRRCRRSRLIRSRTRRFAPPRMPCVASRPARFGPAGLDLRPRLLVPVAARSRPRAGRGRRRPRRASRRSRRRGRAAAACRPGTAGCRR